MRSSAENLFTDDYISRVYNDLTAVKEYNGSLYARLGGKGYPGGEIAYAHILHSSDVRIEFLAVYTDSAIGVYTKKYTVDKEDGRWKYTVNSV